MNKNLKEDIQGFVLAGLMASFLAVLLAVYLVGFNNLSEKEKEDIIILQMINQPQ